MNKQTRRDNDGVCVLKTRALPCFNATSAYSKGGLGQVHWLARLVQGAGSPRYNLYNWSTFWVQETIDEARCVTGWPMALPGGGPARRVTGITLVGQRWRWTKQFADLDTFMARTLSSQQKTPND